MSQSTALASLTATYTDSEGEDESLDNEEKDENQGSVSLPSPVGSGSEGNKSSPATSRPQSPALVRVTTKVATLVSYHDDTVASDDEGDQTTTERTEIILLTETEPKMEATEPIEEDGIQLPPEPPGHCSLDLQEKILRLYEKMQTQQLDMNAIIQKRKDFRNPSIYEKLIHFCSINELGTNYPPAIYDPQKWTKESYYEELAKVQKAEMDKREKERKSRVEFVSGTKKNEDESKKRKSKWDQPGGNAVSSHIRPAGLVQPSLTNSATGTKGTVISAFGSLPKKPRL